MTTDELRDWHARRKYLADMPGLSQQCQDGWTAEHFRMVDDNELHLFPATIDGAASAMPSDAVWIRFAGEWRAFVDEIEYAVVDTGDEIHDRYALAKEVLEENEA